MCPYSNNATFFESKMIMNPFLIFDQYFSNDNLYLFCPVNPASEKNRLFPDTVNIRLFVAGFKHL